jgi:quercetin dioxygenase-like cupin family protein
MAGTEVKSLDAPDERRPFEKGAADFVTVGGTTLVRGSLEPGWRWSEHLKPIVRTDTCEMAHTGYVVSGRLRFVLPDGTEVEVGPGDAYTIPAGHDSYVVGDQTFVAVDFSGGGMADYAKPA